MYLCTDTKLSTFSIYGTLEMWAQTPQCIFDSAEKTVNSDQRLRVWTADGMFTEGQGFFLQPTNSILIISNHVRTTIRGAWTNSFLQWNHFTSAGWPWAGVSR